MIKKERKKKEPEKKEKKKTAIKVQTIIDVRNLFYLINCRVKNCVLFNLFYTILFNFIVFILDIIPGYYLNKNC